MKRALIVLTAFAFVFTMAVPLFAAEVTVGGEIRVRGRYRENLDFDQSDGKANRARLDQRSRIRVSAKIQEGLAAFLELESYGRFAMGNASPQATTNFGTGTDNSAGAGLPGFRFAWFDARLPGTPVTFRLGRQGQSFGHGLVFDSTVYGGDAITARGPLAGWNWELGWVKSRETDTVTVAANYPTSYFQGANAGPAGTDNDEEYWTFKISGSPARNQSLEFYVVWHLDNGGSVPGTAAALGASAAVPFGIQAGGGANEATVGLSWDARFGPFVPRAEFAFQGGDAYKIARPVNAEIGRNAWAVWAGADYHLTPQWRFSLDFAFGSGSGKNPSDPDFQSSRAFVQPNALTSGPWFFADDLGNPGPFIMGDGVTSRRFEIQGLTNLGFVNLAAAWTPVPQWTFQAEAAKLFANRTFDGMGGPVTGGRPDKDLGWNVGSRVTYRPYRNLTTLWMLGAWIPGDYFDGGLPTAVRKADTAWYARWHAIVSF
jgi:hypothetical protein